MCEVPECRQTAGVCACLASSPPEWEWRSGGFKRDGWLLRTASDPLLLLLAEWWSASARGWTAKELPGLHGGAHWKDIGWRGLTSMTLQRSGQIWSLWSSPVARNGRLMSRANPVENIWRSPACVSTRCRRPFWTSWVLSHMKGNQFATIYWNDKLSQLYNEIHLCEDPNHFNEFSIIINNDWKGWIKFNFRCSSTSYAIFQHVGDPWF